MKVKFLKLAGILMFVSAIIVFVHSISMIPNHIISTDMPISVLAHLIISLILIMISDGCLILAKKFEAKN
jgi:hypothetical protein